MNAIAKRPDLMCIKRQPYSYSERTKNKLDLFQDDRTYEFLMVNNFSNFVSSCYTLDVLWCQPMKLIQVVSTSEFHEY